MTKTVVNENKAQGVVVTENVKGFPVTKEMWRTMNEDECPRTNGISFGLPPTLPSEDVLMVRQTCLKAAVEISFPEADTQQVLSTAEEFEKWILRK